MARVLVVDDEPMLRSSMARGLSKMPGLTVDEAGDVAAALSAIDRNAPDVIVSDIDLPDRSGLEILGELGRRGLNVPVVFVSAYMKAFRAQIPKHGNFEALEKPVPLDELRQIVMRKLSHDHEEAPFSVADYLQLSAMGHHSVRIVARSRDGLEGELIVAQGQPWSARFGERKGADAFATIAFRTDLSVSCGRLQSIDGEQNLEGSMDGLLMDAARLFDESNRDGRSSLPPAGERGREEEPAPTTEASPTSEEQPSSHTLERMFERHWEAGVDALLSKNYEAALEAFQTAGAIRPDDQKVIANLRRLEEMGITRAQEESND